MASADTTSLMTRVFDVANETLDNTNPIYGLKKTPLLSLDAALQHSPIYDNLTIGIRLALREADKRLKSGKEKYIFSKDQIAAIQIYTQQSPLYGDLNTKLRSKNRQDLVPYFHYLKLFLTACYLLPPVKTVVYRAVDKSIGSYQQGDVFCWWGFSSTSMKVDVLKDFLGGAASSTIFNIVCVDGVDIQPYSAIPTEAEILLLCGSEFEVEGILSPPQDKGLTIVQLKQTDAPPYLDYTREQVCKCFCICLFVFFSEK